MSKRLIVLLCVICSVASAQQFKIDTLLYSGLPGRRISIVLLGDGYTIVQQNKFRSDCDTLVNGLFKISPFKEYKNYFNIFAVPTISVHTGAASDPFSLIDNYYGSTFSWSGITRSLIHTKEDAVHKVLAGTVGVSDLTMILVNTMQHGGTGGDVAVFYTGAGFVNTGAHEAGHVFADLGDEYWPEHGQNRERPNITQIELEGSVKWKNWMYDSGVMLIPFTQSTPNNKWFRPHGKCKMQQSGFPFCAVCKEAIIATIQRLVSTVDHHSFEQTQSKTRFILDLIKPEPNTLNVQWFHNTELVGRNVDELEMNAGELANGDFIEALVIDTTHMMRRDLMHITTVRWNIGTTITTKKSWTERYQPYQKIITSVEPTVTSTSIRVYPNPVTDQLFVDYQLTGTTSATVSLLDASGRTIAQPAALEGNGGANTHKIDMQGSAAGLYLVKVTVGNYVRTFKVVK